MFIACTDARTGCDESFVTPNVACSRDEMKEREREKREKRRNEETTEGKKEAYERSEISIWLERPFLLRH